MDGGLLNGMVFKVKKCWEGKCFLPKQRAGFNGGISMENLTPRQRGVKRNLFAEPSPMLSPRPTLPIGETNRGIKLVSDQGSCFGQKRMRLSTSGNSSISCSIHPCHKQKEDKLGKKDSTSDPVDSNSDSSDEEEEMDYPSGSEDSSNQSSSEDESYGSSDDEPDNSSGEDSDESSNDDSEDSNDDDSEDDKSDSASEDDDDDSGNDETDEDTDNEDEDQANGRNNGPAFNNAPNPIQAPQAALYILQRQPALPAVIHVANPQPAMPAVQANLIPVRGIPDSRKRIGYYQALQIAYGCVRPINISPDLHFNVIKNLDKKLYGLGDPEYPTPTENAMALAYQVQTLRKLGEVVLMEAFLEEVLKDPNHDLEDIASVNDVPKHYRASAAILPR